MSREIKGKVTRTLQVDLDLTPEEAAAVFLASDSRWQAEFFNAVASIAKEEWEQGKGDLAMQLEYIATPDTGGLTEDGKRVMQMIGDYGYTERLRLRS